MSKTLSFALVLSAGSISREESLASAEAALDAHIAQQETQQATIADAVNAVFDTYKGANLTMPTIEGMTLRHLNAQPANYKVFGKLTLDYVRANAGDRASGKTFGISKGKGGGVCRWVDVPEETEESAPASK